MRRALITGYTGQDGSYLAELLLDKGYEVFGLVRRRATPGDQNVAQLAGQVTVLDGDMTDQASLFAAVERSQPDEVYNLAAQSYVGASWAQPEATAQVTALGALRLLEAVRLVRPTARFYQAGSSEMFGLSPPPQDEATPFHPRSPYGVAKVYAHWAAVNARESYGLFACSGILFNHESPRRGPEFVTRKLARAAARISLGRQRGVSLGNLDARRDWGFAGDYARAIWLLLQQDQPRDFVIGTGETHRVREFAELAFAHVGLDYRDHVERQPSLARPAEVPALRAGPSRAQRQLGWQAEISFTQLVAMMVEHELAAGRDGLPPH
ncbi:MAG TPA: GDP-mannose 4,6-dehydratase [Pirellulales bacterium]|nr:GDP-mannose 4,6-dehydratase [Pirellulales bacterium]